MPVEFLTREQQDSYGTYSQAPSPEQFFRYFYFDDHDWAILSKRRGDHNRVGFAVQLGTMRFLGTFLNDPTKVPNDVINYIGKQFNISDSSCLERYKESEAHRHRDHTAEIKRLYGYHDFNDPSESFKLVRWLYTRSWISEEQPSVMFDLATARLIERKVLLPGVTTLVRLIARIRDRVSTRFWRVLASLPTSEQCENFESLLVIPDNYRQSPLDRLRKAPTRISGPALVDSLNRLEEIRSLDVGKLDLSGIPLGRIVALARYAASARAQTISHMPNDRRIATLLAFTKSFEITAMDDALDLFDL